MIGMTLREIVNASGALWQGAAELLNNTPVNIVYDSRQVVEGSLFVALKGERTDGHRFIPDVLSKGALAVLCEQSGGEHEPRIVVPDVMEALRASAAWNRTRHTIPLVAVTGSVGKTTAKEMLAAVLSARLRTYKTPGSMNGQLGIPAAFISMEDNYDVGVIEMGISLPGEMARIAKIVRPDMAVFMNIGDAHLEALGDHAGILREKSEILSCSSAFAPVFCNGDDLLLSVATFGGRPIVRFGMSCYCDVRAEDIEIVQNGTQQRCTIVSGNRRIPVHIPAYGTYMVYAALAAAAVGMTMGLSDDEIVQGILNYKTVGRRSRVISTSFGTLVDDCYNANPNSNRAAIDSLSNLPGRKVCILGDMLELGENSHELHHDLGVYAVEHGVDAIYTHGAEAAYICAGAGMKGRHFTTKQEMIDMLPQIIQPGDTVLVKASHGARFEDIAEVLETM